jgi:F0F1-type ATP synthase assembly protein I
MNTEGLLILTFIFTTVFMLIQRSERKRRLLVAACLAVVVVLAVRYTNYRDYHTEAVVGFIIAVVFNGLFWMLFGRYNPPADSDEMKVLGMDD